LSRLFFIILLSVVSLSLFSQPELIIEGIDTILYTRDGYDIPRSDPVKLIFKNNRLIPTQDQGFTLQCGDDGLTNNSGNLDAAVISGNRLYSDSEKGSHGMMAGYSENYHIKYNLIDGIPYGIVAEGITGQHYTKGGVYYNVFKSNRVNSIVLAGLTDFPIINNTFYSTRSVWSIGTLRISSNNVDSDAPTSAIIKNNIFYAKSNYIVFNIDSASLSRLECDYNLYWIEDGHLDPRFYNSTTGKEYSWYEWKALGFDTHSVVMDPEFIENEIFVPSKRLNYGTPLGEEYSYGLAKSAEWIVGESPDTIKQDSIWQVGAIILDTAVEKLNDDSDKLALIPNPNSGEFIVSLTGIESSNNLEISVYSIDGKTIFKDSLENSEKEVHISLPSNKQGIYLFRLCNDTNSITKKFIVN